VRGSLPVSRTLEGTSPAQVSSWHEAAESHVRLHVGDWDKSGRVVLNLSFVVRDPNAEVRQVDFFTA